MSDLVVIKYKGKEYIGTILRVDAVIFEDKRTQQKIVRFKCRIFEKDTDCVIDNIYISNSNDIIPYEH